MAEWIDTHAHLDDVRLHRQLDAVLARAKSAGLAHILAVATTRSSSEACLAMAASHPEFLGATVGIHPNNVAESAPTDWDAILRLASQPGVRALGEMGLDRHWHDTPFDQQQDYFARHLALSRQTKLPVVIHCREADADMLPMLREDYNKNGPLIGVMHSFCGDAAMAAECIAMGLHISFAGMLTYKNADALRSVASTIPLDRLLVETDSPYLTPVPFRGKLNEPSYVVHTGNCLAEAKSVSPEVIATATTANACRLFRFAP